MIGRGPGHPTVLNLGCSYVHETGRAATVAITDHRPSGGGNKFTGPFEHQNKEDMQIGVDSFVAATVDAAGRAVDPAR